MAVTEMTPKEVIIEIDRCKQDGHMPVDWERRRAAIEAAKQAVEKTDAREVVCDGDNEDDFIRCPDCQHVLAMVDDIFVRGMQPEYCEKCGQRLLWD